MKKIYYSLLLSFLSCQIVFSQNLVLNPSFENTTGTCTGFTAGESFSQVINWNNANSNIPGDSCSSPDLFSPCNTLPLIGGPGPMFAPNNLLGTQCAKSGNRYAGIITNEMGSGFGQSYREYIQGRLSSPLQAGQTYCVSFYISLGDDVTFSTNNIGVFFSNTEYMRDACAQGSLINETPQLNFGCQVVSETNQWIRLQWNYVATGGESFFMIGNFFSDANTNIQGTGVTSLNPYAYYYIDDVSVELGSCNFAEIITTGTNGCGGQSNPGDPAFTFCISDPAENLIAQEGISCPITAPSGTWSGTGITNSTTGTFNPTTAGVGTHTITYTTQGGFIATIQILVSNCEAVEVCVESDGSLTASGGTAPYNWQNETTVQDCSSCFIGCAFPPGCAVNVNQWATFATGTNITAPTNYPIQVVDGIGTTLLITSSGGLPACSADPCAGITISPTITPTHVTCTTSGSAIASATGGTSPYSFTWNTTPAQTGTNATGLSAGNYTVTVEDDNGCIGTQSVTINPATNAPTVTITPTHPTCTTSGSAIASATGGTAPYSYTWNTTPTQTGTNATGLAAGNYSVTVEDDNGCTTTQTVTINPAANAPTVTITPTHETCTNSGSAIATATGGTAPYSYTWNTTPTQTGTNATGLAAGNYTVTVEDNNGCTTTQTVTINPATSAPTVTITPTHATCTTNGMAIASVTGGTGPYSFLWNTTPPQTSSIASDLSPGNYTVTVEDNNGCIVTQTVTINPASNAPVITLQSSQNVSCNGSANGSATVNVTGGISPYNYNWSPSGGTAATASNLSGGNYTVLVTDNAGCTAQLSVTITEPTPIVVTATTKPEMCDASDGEISLLATGGTGSYTYNWTPNVSNTNTATNLVAGQYSVIVTDGAGCSTTVNITVEIGSTFPIDAYPETSVIEIGGSVNLFVDVDTTVINVVSVTWTPSNGLSCDNCFEPTASPSTTTTYIVVVESDNGCFAYDTVTVVVEQPCGQLFVPSIFSPNLDGLNDLECVMGGCITTLDFTIFNRWGEAVFTSDNQADCWDGTFRGKPVQSGVYVYKLKATLSTGESINQSGNINVVR